MIILIIILTIITLLLLGIRISFEFKKAGSEFEGCLKILIFKKIKIYSKQYPSQNKDKTETEDKKEDENSQDIKKILELAKPCINDILGFLKKAIKSIKVSKIENHLIFGLDSYADTGEYIGIIWSVFAIIDSFDKNIKLTAEPYFNGGSVIDGCGINEVEIYPLKLIVPGLQLILKKEIRLLVKEVL
ncbi:MAG: DUF2953 domain-containing protein [Methanobrevibacter sp.]|nr:DUF2953 domain-containing protein [Methanobrevibacter sp.]